MNPPTYCVGLDIAAEQCYAAVGTAPWKLRVPGTEFSNDPEGFQQFQQWLQQHDCTPAQTILCMEATGVYGEHLAAFLVSHEYRVAVEPPWKVKRAFTPSGPKTEAVDSQPLAEYACRYFDELRVWQPPAELLEQLQVLLTTREQRVPQSTAQQNALKALRRKRVRTPFAEQVHDRRIAELKSQIKALEREIRRLIEQEPPFRDLLTLLLTIPGVGLLLATHLLSLTRFATEPVAVPKLAAHLGLCPFERRSGKSLHQRLTSRHYGPRMPRKLLHLAARSLSTHNDYFRAYFERKVAEGKPKSLVLNNIANKLLKRMCAILESQQPYDPHYRSVQPTLKGS
jgi:transposase